MSQPELEELDTTDLDRWVGEPLGGNRLREPMTVMDIRRWAQAMENANQLHFDHDFATESAFGQIVAPQSFTPWWCPGQGGISGTFGEIPGAHLSHVGDEWWFYGPRLYPGDQVRCDRMAYDYRIANTGFAGPTVFQRGDTTYVNQHGVIVAKQRTTMMRFSPTNARRITETRGAESAKPAAKANGQPVTCVDTAQVAKEKLEYYRSYGGHLRRVAGDVTVDEALPTGVFGPHSVSSFATQWRARPDNVWGALEPDTDLLSAYPHETAYEDMQVDANALRWDPARSDGLYHGPAAGHVDGELARRIGMPREFGFGFVISTWALDYVANWAGQLGFVVHSKLRHKAPVLAGDVTYASGAVRGVCADPRHPGKSALATLDVELASQTGTVISSGTFEVRLPCQTS